MCQIKKIGVIVNDNEDFLKYIVFMDKTFLNIKGHINVKFMNVNSQTNFVSTKINGGVN